MLNTRINRLTLALLIYKKGEEILPYSAYVKANKPELYKVLVGKLERYREYVCQGFT
jgi:hypothetical protein